MLEQLLRSKDAFVKDAFVSDATQEVGESEPLLHNATKIVVRQANE